jgi:hypothetical protein
MPHPHDHCLVRKRGHSEKRPQKGGDERTGRGRDGRKKRKNQRRRERTRRGFFRKLRKITENRENTNRGEKKPKNWGCKQRTDENKIKGINREKDQNRRTQLEGTNNTGETWKRKQRRMNRSKPGNKEQRKQKKSKKRGEEHQPERTSLLLQQPPETGKLPFPLQNSNKFGTVRR